MVAVPIIPKEIIMKTLITETSEKLCIFYKTLMQLSADMI